MHPLLSLCMIVKNEEKVIDRCLESIQGLVDEIIIIDTGSTDSTKQIASKYTTHIYDYEWNNDFAAARNESIRYANGEWIIILDADEYIKTAPERSNLIPYLSKLERYMCGNITILNYYGSQADQSTDLIRSSAIRIFRNVPEIRFIGAVHEQLSAPTPLSTVNIPIELYHTGYTLSVVEEKQKTKRNLKLLKSMDPAFIRSNPYYAFVMGNELLSDGKHEDAMYYYEISKEQIKPEYTWVAFLYDKYIYTLLYHQLHDKAYHAIQQALSTWNEYADFHYYEGVIYEQLGIWNKAMRSYSNCLSKEQFINSSAINSKIRNQIISLALRTRQHQEAVLQILKSLKQDPFKAAPLQQLMNLLCTTDSASHVVSFLDSVYDVRDPAQTYFLFRCSLTLAHPELSEHYRSRCLKAQIIPLSTEDELAYRLIKIQPSDRMPTDANTLSETIALSAALVYRNIEYLNYTTLLPQPLKEFLHQWLQTNEERTLLPVLDEPSLNRMLPVLVFLKRSGYEELFFELVQQIADAPTLIQLAHSLFDLDDTGTAYEFYSYLLDHNQLDDVGTMRLGIFFIELQDYETAHHLLMNVLDTSTRSDLLGWILPLKLPEEFIAPIKESFFLKFPPLRNLPIWQ